jgi:hypothetical protein
MKKGLVLGFNTGDRFNHKHYRSSRVMPRLMSKSHATVLDDWYFCLEEPSRLRSGHFKKGVFLQAADQETGIDYISICGEIRILLDLKCVKTTTTLRKKFLSRSGTDSSFQSGFVSDCGR